MYYHITVISIILFCKLCRISITLSLLQTELSVNKHVIEVVTYL